MPWNYKRKEGNPEAPEASRVFFEKVEDYRRKHRFNVTQLSEHLGISRHTYYDWQKGRVPQKGLRKLLNRVLEA